MQKGFAPILILVGIVLVIVIVGGAYYMGTKKAPIQQVQNPAVTQTSQPTSVSQGIPSPTTDETSSLKTYTSQYMSFQYPSAWGPAPSKARARAATVEELDLNIPGYGLEKIAGGNTIGFYGIQYDSKYTPPNTISSQPIMLGGRQGMKLILKCPSGANVNCPGGNTFAEYRYETVGYQNTGSFSVDVIVSAEDKNLETQLDQLVKTIVFK